MTKFKYNPGDIQNQCKLISRDYKDNSGNWYCTFQCLKCGKVFQYKLKKVFNENIKKCDCSKFQDSLIGQKKGVLTIIKEAPKHLDDRNLYWICKCECGNEFEISTTNFNRREHKQCNCNSNFGGRPLSNNLIGKNFGKLKVLKYLKNQMWECQCECGNIANKRTDSLLNHKGLACPVCLKSISTGELLLQEIFNSLNIKYEYQKSFDTCRFPNTNKLARFDFYLPDFNILIEYNGEQHYRNSGWQTEERFESTQYRDQYKIQWCKENSIPLIIIPYTVNLSIDYIKSILYRE